MECFLLLGPLLCVGTFLSLTGWTCPLEAQSLQAMWCGQKKKKQHQLTEEPLFNLTSSEAFPLTMKSFHSPLVSELLLAELVAHSSNPRV